MPYPSNRDLLLRAANMAGDAYRVQRAASVIRARASSGARALATRARALKAGMPPWLWFALLGATGVAVAVLVFLKRKELAMVVGAVVKKGQEAAFAMALPTEAQPYADVILQVAREKGVDPFVLAAIGQRESRWGQALRPPGPSGTGDFTSRTWTKTPMPPDGQGWGRGIMQVDYAYYQPWLDSHDWTEPYVNISKGAEILQQKIAFLTSRSTIGGIADGSMVTLSNSAAQRRGVSAGQYPDPRPLSGEVLTRSAIAAYNGGEANILMSVAAGVDPDVTTAGAGYGNHDYAADVLARAAQMADSFLSVIA